MQFEQLLPALRALNLRFFELLITNSDLGLDWVRAVCHEFRFLVIYFPYRIWKMFRLGASPNRQVHLHSVPATPSIPSDLASSDVDCAMVSFQGFSHYALQKDVKEYGG